MRRVLFLGTAGYHPSESRQTACIMLPESGLVLDAGTGFFRVREHLASAKRLDIFLSHTHLDHCCGISFLFDVLYEQPIAEANVYAAPEKIAALRAHLLSEHLFPAELPIVWHELSERHTLACGGRLTHHPLKHPGGSRAYRIDWNDWSLAYVTDTTAALDASYVDFIRGVELLIHACNFADGMEEHAELPGHSCATPVAEVARAAGVEMLVLTHLNPLSPDADPVGLEGMRKIFPLTFLAHDGMELTAGVDEEDIE
mgnify:FL=1